MAGKTASGGPNLRPPEDQPPTYAEQGLGKRDVARWKKLAGRW